jgi:putative transposase
MILKGYKYRIYPNKEQQVFLAKHFGATRYIYNWGLDHKIKHYETTKKSINWVALNNLLPSLKKDLPWLSEIGSQTLQMEIRNLDTAFKNFFRAKKGFPKFKSKHNNHQSFQIPDNNGKNYSIQDGKLYIPKLKSGIKIVQHRDFDGVMKMLTLSKNPSGQYFATILVETNENIVHPKPIHEETTIGIDLGLKEFLITSNGDKIDNPKHFKNTQKKLAKAQRKISRKEKGSNNRNKQRIKVAKIHQKIVNQRSDFQHKLSSKLISENQTICLEDLNVKGMMKNRKLSKAIGDVSWSSFTNMLFYKALWYGTNLISIGRFDPSTKLCSECGVLNNNLTLKDRIWICDCGAKHDRDVNAAINIKNFGLVKSNYPLLKLNTVGSTEINACQIRADISHSGQEDTTL